MVRSALSLCLVVLFSVPAFPQANPGRTITVVNKCSFPVWIGNVGGSISNARGPMGCTTDAQCGAGRGCSQTNLCFWKLPAPTSGDWELKPAGQTGDTATFQLPPASYSPPDNNVADIRWSGAIFPRTGCQFNAANVLICDTGTCFTKPGQKQCVPGNGGTPPTTQAEFTLDNKQIDYYDLELINGATIPMEMRPDPAGSYKPVPANAKPEYWCGNPGGNPSLTGLDACLWEFIGAAPGATPQYRYVSWLPEAGKPTPKVCTSDAACDSGQKCGLTLQAIVPPPPAPNPVRDVWGKLTCGKPLGYWSPIGICGTNKEFGPYVSRPGQLATNLYDCNLPKPQPDGPYRTLTDLYGCVVPNPLFPRITLSSTVLQADSTATAAATTCRDATCPAQTCYSTDPKATPQCCGCADWPYPTETPCQNHNPAWATYAYPKLLFLKNACPSAYSYQYDDKTSTFICQTVAPVNPPPGTPLNNASYVITFCPGGLSGGVGQ